jgi:intracellular sulfur oxidation DsrE/DsrF family protein
LEQTLNTRKNFLLTSSVFALAPALADAAAPTRTHASKKKLPLTFTFDRARFDEILAKPAKHKQCFGATKLEGGGVLFAMHNSIDAYEGYLKEGSGAMQAVAVLYHGASVALALNDAIWNEYITPLFRDKTYLRHATADEREQIAHLTLGRGNPFLRSASKDPDDISVERLVSGGSSFFVCHNAIAGFSGIVSDAVKQPVEKIHAAVMAGIVPGALVVPAGVMAINACQEAKFTYIQSSV